MGSNIEKLNTEQVTGQDEEMHKLVPGFHNDSD